MLRTCIVQQEKICISYLKTHEYMTTNIFCRKPIIITYRTFDYIILIMNFKSFNILQ